MLEECEGDLFASGAAVLVNPVNCVGPWGRGIARQFKQRFPAAYRDFRDTLTWRRLEPGGVLVLNHDAPAIVCVATKNHWRDQSRMEWVVEGAGRLRDWLLTTEHSSMALPALGCGLGGLDWSAIQPLLREVFADIDREIWLFNPQ